MLLRRYHREHSGDLIWEIGSGYFNCRRADGTFDAETYVENANPTQVRMTEFELGQGANPGSLVQRRESVQSGATFQREVSLAAA